jgi:hypothetical protein
MPVRIRSAVIGGLAIKCIMIHAWIMDAWEEMSNVAWVPAKTYSKLPGHSRWSRTHGGTNIRKDVISTMLGNIVIFLCGFFADPLIIIKQPKN